MEWNVDYYVKESGESPVRDFILALPPKLRAKVIWEIDLLKRLGTSMKEPYAKSIKGEKYKGLWELRVQRGSDISRVFYFLPIGNTFVLLHGFIKKGSKTPDKELALAMKNMNDYKRRREKNG